jgi:non-homologous end joining protein Ku
LTDEGNIALPNLRNHFDPDGFYSGKAGGAGRTSVRKLIAFDDDTFDKLKQLGRDRMATIQELADEAFADMLKKHGIPIDLKDALRKSASRSKAPAKKTTGSTASKPTRSRKPKS